MILVPAVHFSKKMPAQLNNVHVGLSEAEFIEILGNPKKVEQIDAKTKMFFIAKLKNAPPLVVSNFWGAFHLNRRSFLFQIEQNYTLHIK